MARDHAGLSSDLDLDDSTSRHRTYLSPLYVYKAHIYTNSLQRSHEVEHTQDLQVIASIRASTLSISRIKVSESLRDLRQ